MFISRFEQWPVAGAVAGSADHKESDDALTEEYTRRLARKEKQAEMRKGMLMRAETKWGKPAARAGSGWGGSAFARLAGPKRNGVPARGPQRLLPSDSFYR